MGILGDATSQGKAFSLGIGVLFRLFSDEYLRRIRVNT